MKMSWRFKKRSVFCLWWSSYGPEVPGTTCSIQWHQRSAAARSYIICLFVFCLLLPLLMMLFCYGRILLAAREVARQVSLLCEWPLTLAYLSVYNFSLFSNVCTVYLKTISVVRWEFGQWWESSRKSGNIHFLHSLFKVSWPCDAGICGVEWKRRFEESFFTTYVLIN